MKTTTVSCDIENREHSAVVKEREIPFMFDYDQEDGKSKTTAYFELLEIDICEDCFKYFTENKILPYAYGAMGYNKHYLNPSQ